jgi:hypothetical protein
MSEYQYYEFQAIDQPLDADARAEIESLSSRVYLTASSASFVYNYSDFPANPQQVLAEHFDMMLYIANWGTKQLMFRLPKTAIDADAWQPYLYDYEISLETVGDYYILNIKYDDDLGGGWVEGQGWLPPMISLRDELLQGDLRVLYLAWINAAADQYHILGDDEDLPEPPVPPGLGQLNAAHRTFMDFFEIDPDLVTAATQNSKPKSDIRSNLAQYLDQLPAEEMREYLKRLLAGEHYVGISLRKRLQELASTPTLADYAPSARGIRVLMEQAKEVEQQRITEEKRQAEAKRRKRAQKTAAQEEQLWRRVSQLVADKRTKAYEEAVNILKDLRDLAQVESRLDGFRERVKSIREQNPTLRGLHRRMEAAGLFD